MTMFKLSPNETRKLTIECMEAGLVPLISSSPGLGKSALVKAISTEFDLELIDLRLSQCAPEDLMGLPMRTPEGKAAFAPFKMFPLKGDPMPAGKNGWLLFLDEFVSATKMVQAAAYKLALDRMVGQEDLHENCFVVAAGNLMTDKAIVTQMSTAMQSRLVHLEMEVHHGDFMRNAIKCGFDSRVMGFLEFQPNKLQDFKPDHADRTFACPRTWEFASKLIKGKATRDVSKALLAGAISDGVAVEFYSFMEEYDKLPSFYDITSKPDSTAVPPASSTRYAVVTMVLEKTDKSNLADVATYVRRLPPEFQVIFFRGLIQRDPTIRREKAYCSNINHLTKFLTEDDDDDGLKQAA